MRANAGARRSGAKVTLRVEPARVLDVQYQAQQIKDRINAYFGYAAIADVRFLQAPVELARAAREDRPNAPEARSDEPHAEANDLAAALARLEANVTREKSAG